MADSHFVDFALIPSPMRKEKQFRLPDDFSEFDFTILSWTSHSAWFSRAFSSSHITDRPLFSDPENVLHNEDEARNSTFTSDLRGRNRHLLAAVIRKDHWWN